MLLRYLVFVFALVAGICVLQYLPRLPPLWPFCVLVLMCAGIAWRWRRGSLPLLIIAFFAAGVGYASVRAQWRLSEWLTPALEGQVVEAEGYVCDLPQTTHFGSRFLFVPTKLITADAHLPSKIQVQWYGDKQRVQAGERWRLVLKAKRPHGQVNPGGFDLESWFLQQNIGATASVQFGQKLDGTAGAAWLARLRSGLRDKINAALPEASYSGVVVALTVGDQSGIPQEQWKRFAATGVTHLISISGLHITLLAGLAIGLVNRGWRRVPFLVSRFGAPRAALIAGMITALGYSALAGMAVPTQRTLLMLVTAGVCLWRARPAATSAIWATALLAVVLIDPFAVLAVGFWLSFLTVGALLWVGGNRLAEGPKWQGWLTTQTAATIGSAPILLVVFGQLPLLSPIANAFAIPVVSMLVTPLALVGLLDPTGWVLRGAERLFAVTDWVLMQCAALPVTSSGFMSPPLWSLAPAAVGVALLLAPRGMPGRLLGGVFLLPLFVLQSEPLPLGTFRATVLDVGQGLAVLVETRHSALLFDTGQLPNGERVILPALRAAGRLRLDELLLSHNDNDHVGAAEVLLTQLPINETLHSLPDTLPWLAPVKSRQRCTAGAAWEKDGVTFRLLWPPEGFLSKQDNANSCVLLVDNGKHRLLIPADLGGREEAQLVATGLPRSDIVIAGHHGGKGSSSTQFVEAIRAQFAVFSVGYRNHFGHPRLDTLERYASAGTRNLRTDQSGALIFNVDERITVVPWRDYRRRYWYAPASGVAEGEN